jgi:hypothetical protein
MRFRDLFLEAEDREEGVEEEKQWLVAAVDDSVPA